MFALLACSIPLCGFAEDTGTSSGFGFALNSGLNGEVYPFRLVPSATYYHGKNHLELGFGFHPFIRKYQHIYSGELNYKYFPNGMENKFNMYFVGSLTYLSNRRDTYYPSTYKYLFLNGGYGFQVTVFRGVYMGTNIEIGTFTTSKNSENPIERTYGSEDMFEEFGANIAFQFNLGYRF